MRSNGSCIFDDDVIFPARICPRPIVRFVLPELTLYCQRLVIAIAFASWLNHSEEESKVLQRDLSLGREFL